MKGTIICYGDSNTYGYDPRSFIEDRYPRQVRWTGILSERSGWEIRNHGMNGRCIPHDPSQLRFACEQTESWSSLEAPVWLWIMLGTNDLLMEAESTAEMVGARMRKFLEKLLGQPAVQCKKVNLRLISPPSMEYGAWVNEERIIQESKKMDSIYREIAQELGICFTGTGDWKIPLVFDGVHFSEQGHRNFAEALLQERIWNEYTITPDELLKREEK